MGSERDAGQAKVAGTKNELGFTLVETAIALVLMMIIGLSVASLFSYAINYNSGAADRAIAQAVAQQRMEQLRKTRFSDVVSATDPAFVSAGRTYMVETTVGGSATLKMITVRVTPQAATAAWARNPVILITQRADNDAGTYY